MKSIRISLLVYFLVLLALALGLVSVLVYKLTEQSLHASDAGTRKVLEDRYKERRAAEDRKLNNELVRRAQNLANLAQVPTGRTRSQPLSVAGLMSSGLHPLQALRVAGLVTNGFNPQGPLLITGLLTGTLDG